MIKIVFLGTSSGVPTKDRNLPAVFMMYKDDRLLFDCGEGTQRQLMSLKLKFMKIDRIFISHWHADHFAGLLGLIQTMCLEGRREPLYVYGPQESRKFVEQLLTIGYYFRAFEVVVKELKEGNKVDCGEYEIIPFKVEHNIPALGYVFSEKERMSANMEKAAKFGLSESPIIGDLKDGKTITYNGKTVKPEDVIEKKAGRKVVYTGDTKYCENIVKFSMDADVLICDSTFSSDFVDKAGSFKHSTSKQAAEIAKKANVGKLFLTHISRRYQENGLTEEKLEEDARKVFKNVALARDFMEYRVK
ncbi:MAG: ribonuclease Z [archaeon]